MESFYGGRQGDSVNIVACFTDTTESEVVVVNKVEQQRAVVTTPAVENMMRKFREGAHSTSEIGYGEYVIVNTSYTHNENNGNLYRRGFDYSALPIYKIRENKAKEYGFPKKVAQRIVAEHENVANYTSVSDTMLAEYFKKPIQNGDNVYYYFLDEVVLKDLSYSQDFIDEITWIERNNTASNKSWNCFYLFSGAGAEYMGRVLGPIGKTPSVEVGHYYDIMQRLEDVGTNEYFKSSYTDYQIDNTDMYEATKYDKDNRIYIDWVNVEDVNGNIVGWQVGFKMPYLKQVYHTKIREPYYTNEESAMYPSADDVQSHWAIVEGYSDFLLQEHEEVKKPFYHEWTLQVPKGPKGDSVSRLRTFNGRPELYAFYNTFEEYEYGKVRDAISYVYETNEDGSYKLDENGEPIIEKDENGAPIVAVDKVNATYVGNLNMIQEFAITEASLTDNDGNLVPANHLLVLYTTDKTGPIQYKNIDGWFDLGQVRGRDAGNICYYYQKDYGSKSALDSAVAALSSPPETLFGSDKMGWGILGYYTSSGKTYSYSILYDYQAGKWKAIPLAVGDVIDPKKALTADPDKKDNLVTEGYFFHPSRITNVYEAMGAMPSAQVKTGVVDIVDSLGNVVGSRTVSTREIDGYGYRWWEWN